MHCCSTVENNKEKVTVALPTLPTVAILFVDSCHCGEMIAERDGCIGYRSHPRCVTVFVLREVYRAEVHLKYNCAEKCVTA